MAANPPRPPATMAVDEDASLDAIIRKHKGKTVNGDELFFRFWLPLVALLGIVAAVIHHFR